MPITTLSSREFNQDSSRAKKAANDGPVFITDRASYLPLRDELVPIWKSIMGSHYPSMSLVEVKALLNSSAFVEIEATAVVPE